MDLTEARGLLAEFVSPYRRMGRAELEKMAGRETVEIVSGRSGSRYRLELHVTRGTTRDPTTSVMGTATEEGSRRWFKQRAVVGFSVLEDGRVAFESGFPD